MKRRVLAAALAVLLVLPLGACGSPAGSGSGGSRSPALSKLALNQPIYPDCPQQPDFADFGDDWEGYDQASTEYYEQLSALRGDGISSDTVQALSNFAGRSTALAIEGMEGQNSIYSPLSLWAALAMLAQCAGGESRQQVLSALGSDGLEELRGQVAQVWQGLYTDDGVSSLLLANSIWLNSSLEGSYVEETLETLARDYYAGAFAVPMGTAQADQAVTDWVSEQTHGLIGGEEPVVETKEYTLALLASSCAALAQAVFSLKERRHAAVPVAGLALAGAWLLFPDAFSLDRWMENVVWPGNLLLGFGLPLLLLLVKKLRGQV